MLPLVLLRVSPVLHLRSFHFKMWYLHIQQSFSKLVIYLFIYVLYHQSPKITEGRGFGNSNMIKSGHMGSEQE